MMGGCGARFVKGCVMRMFSTGCIVPPGREIRRNKAV